MKTFKVKVAGADIHVREWGAGEPIVFVHGLGAHGGSWVHQVAVFSERFRMLAVDLCGFGESDKPRDPARYSIDSLAEDIAGVAKELGLEHIRYVGTSMGGFIGATLALAHPELCRSLVLCHTAARMSIPPDVMSARLAALQSMTMQEYAALVIGQALEPSADDELRAWLADMIARNDPWAYTQTLSKGLASFDARDRVGRIAVPTLVLNGEHDRIIPPEAGRELAGLIPGSRLVEIEHTNHLSYAERPSAFNEAVLPFVERA
ncbi:MAG: alpha/beta fold hydrolase [Candidatus Binatia bacterium]